MWRTSCSSELWSICHYKIQEKCFAVCFVLYANLKQLPSVLFRENSLYIKWGIYSWCNWNLSNLIQIITSPNVIITERNTGTESQYERNYLLHLSTSKLQLYHTNRKYNKSASSLLLENTLFQLNKLRQSPRKLNTIQTKWAWQPLLLRPCKLSTKPLTSSIVFTGPQNYKLIFIVTLWTILLDLALRRIKKCSLQFQNFYHFWHGHEKSWENPNYQKEERKTWRHMSQ